MPGTQQQQRGSMQRRGSGMEVDWDRVPDSAGLPGGVYNVRIEALTEGTTGGGKACWIGTHKVLSHPNTKKYAGRTNRTWYVIGSDDDPMATDVETINDAMGTGMLKRMFKAAGVPLQRKLALTCKGAIGKQLSIIGQFKRDNNGVWRFNITDYIVLGKREPEVFPVPEGAGGDNDARTASSNGRVSHRQAAPSEDENPDGEDEEKDTSGTGDG